MLSQRLVFLLALSLDLRQPPPHSNLLDEVNWLKLSTAKIKVRCKSVRCEEAKIGQKEAKGPATTNEGEGPAADSKQRSRGIKLTKRNTVTQTSWAARGSRM